MSRRIIGGVVAFAFLVYILRGSDLLWAFLAVAGIGALVFLLVRRGPGGGSGYLCDTCKYSYGDVCTRPEKPNATKCPDYKKSGT
jgi:hypothetical protein